MEINIKFTGQESIQSQLENQNFKLTKELNRNELNECQQLLNLAKSSKFNIENRISILKGIAVRLAGVIKSEFETKPKINIFINKSYTF